MAEDAEAENVGEAFCRLLHERWSKRRAANLPPTAVGYCVNRNADAKYGGGVNVAMEGPSGVQTIRVTSAGNEDGLRVARSMIAFMPHVPALLVRHPESFPGPWDTVIDAGNAHISQRLSPGREIELRKNLGERRANKAASALWYVTSTRHMRPLGDDNSVAMAVRTYELNGNLHLASAITWSDGTVRFQRLNLDPVSIHEAEIATWRRAALLTKSWALPSPHFLITNMALRLDLHAINAAGESPKIVAAMRGYTNASDLEHLAALIREEHVSHSQEPLTGSQLKLVQRARRCAYAETQFAPLDLATDDTAWRALPKGADATLSRIQRAAADVGGTASDLVLRGRHRPAAPSKPQQKLLRELNESERQGKTLSGRPVVSVDASVGGDYATCAVIMNGHGRLITVDLTGHAGSPADTTTAETLALMIGLAHAPQEAVVVCDNESAVIKCIARDYPTLSETSEITELYARAIARTDCTVVWRRRNSTAALTLADKHSGQAMERLLKRPKPLAELLENETNTDTGEIRMKKYRVRAYDGDDREYVYAPEAEAPEGAIRKAFKEHAQKFGPEGPELGSVVWVSGPETPIQDEKYLLLFRKQEDGTDSLSRIEHVKACA